MAASDIVGTVGGAASGIASMTGVGSWLAPIISLATTGISAGLKASEASKQKEQAEKMRREALNTQKQALRPEFKEKQRIEKMQYLAGLPALGQAQKTLDENTASNLRAIREQSPNGAATLAAISAGLSAQGRATNDLSIKNAEYKDRMLTNIGGTSWSIGEKQRALEDIRDKQMATGLSSAAAMESAATYNKQNAADTLLGGISSTATSLAGNSIGGGGKTTNEGNIASLLSSAQAARTDPNSAQQTSSLLSPQAQVQDIQLTQQDAFDLTQKLKQKDPTVTDAQALQILRSMGYKI